MIGKDITFQQFERMTSKHIIGYPHLLIFGEIQYINTGMA